MLLAEEATQPNPDLHWRGVMHRELQQKKRRSQTRTTPARLEHFPIILVHILS